MLIVSVLEGVEPVDSAILSRGGALRVVHDLGVAPLLMNEGCVLLASHVSHLYP